METNKGKKTPHSERSSRAGFALKELVSIIGYQLAAYIGRTNVWAVKDWLQHGMPEHLRERMQAALDVAGPIATVESELVAQFFLVQKMTGIEPFKYAATMLRDAPDLAAARSLLMEAVRREYLCNVADHLEEIESRLQDWISRAQMPPNTAYRVGLWRWDRLWLELLHAGTSADQQRKWDCGKEWPLWDELIAAVPEMEMARISQNLETGYPFRYLRRAHKKQS